ncbi:DUF362 domain-containing protein [bacterium]|nr:DUF362 domain-containing protein [bacterium]
MKRREFLKRVFIAIAGLGLSKYLRIEKSAEGETRTSKIYVAKGNNPENTTYKAVKAAGGIEKFVKRGSKVVIKPNIAWNRKPEQAANTNPYVVSALVKLCKRAGASEVVVIDHTCNPWKVTYKISGIAEAVERAGGIMRPPTRYRKVSISGTKVLKQAEVLEEVLDADVVIDVPVVKVHGSRAKITISMKNLMGVVKDRGYFHRTDLNRCIAEISYFIKPTLTVVDATRILLTRGPQGPGKVKNTGIVVAGTDMVALDSFGAKLLGLNPENVPHLIIGKQLGLGEYDLNRVRIKYV